MVWYFIVGYAIRDEVENTRLEAKANDTKKFRGQGQTLSRLRPRTQAQVFSKKKGFQKNFSSNLKKKVFKNFFQAEKVLKNFFSGDFHLRKTKKNLRKFTTAAFLVLYLLCKHFRAVSLASSNPDLDLERICPWKVSPLPYSRFLALSNKISTVQKIVLSSSRGQGNFRGLEASRPRPRTSKCVLEDVLEAKDVLADSTSVCYCFYEMQLAR